MIINTKDPEYKRDLTNGALLNKDSKARQEYLARKAHTQRLEKLENDVADVKDDIRAIHGLLQQLVGNYK